MEHAESTTQGQGQGHRPRHRGGRAQPRSLREQARTAERADPDNHGQPDTNTRPPPRQQRRAHRSERPAEQPTSTGSTDVPPRPSRRERFKAKLSEVEQGQGQPDDATPSPAEKIEKSKSKPRHPRQPPPGDDLTSTLTRALRTPPFPDCSICFNSIRPEQATWSCSPPASSAVEARLQGHSETHYAEHCCWSTFHLKCIRAWAEKSVKELAEAWRARGEDRPGEWHCPGCRATRQAVPLTYTCFCFRVRNPAPPRIATPHSCAQPCSRPRSACQHACPLPCHPGPCPPCAVTVQAACFCGKEKHSAKCQAGETALSFSCPRVCQKTLRCGHSGHRCTQKCHEGPCPPCSVKEEVRCWCGRDTKQVPCGEVRTVDSTRCVVIGDDGSERAWIGSYGCSRPCERSFACSNHSCSKPCHPPSPTPPPCPFDPERVVSCACGQYRVARSFNDFAASSSARAARVLQPRASCTAPLPTCPSPCSKMLTCGHLCQATCHWGPCPPCTEQVERMCRCGSTKHRTRCDDPVVRNQPADGSTFASDTILCDKPCQAMRFCGRHPCGRICCPLGPLQRVKLSKRRDPTQADADAFQLDPAARALHQCDLPCNRVLGCENHRCEELDHKGPCPPCPRGVFEELVCPCGRTALEPPIRCGTRLQCAYPCARPAQACGHPRTPHGCHESAVVAGSDTAEEGLGIVVEVDRPCPPCVVLTDKLCACGKKRVGNVRCSQERVSCGSACGKLLACGFHHCERTCHADPCGLCSAVCGKPRKSCFPALHPCTQTCHAPAACPETEPCLTPVTLTCPCGHLRSTVPCSGTKLALACTGECEIKKRNARLAEALGISDEKREARSKTTVTWSVEIIASARVMGQRFVGIVEKAFADFIASDRKIQVLPHMRPEQRKFVHDLASVYRMDTVMVDQEPHRSVQLIRRIDTRVPAPLLSQHIMSTMGRLVDLKLTAGKNGNAGSGAGAAASAWGAGTSTGNTGASVGWNAVARSALAAGGSRSGSMILSSVAGATTPTSTNPGLGAAGGARGGVWVSPSVQALRGRTDSAQAMADNGGSVPGASEASVGAVSGGGGQEVMSDGVPDHWEDDV